MASVLHVFAKHWGLPACHDSALTSQCAYFAFWLYSQSIESRWIYLHLHVLIEVWLIDTSFTSLLASRFHNSTTHQSISCLSFLSLTIVGFSFCYHVSTVIPYRSSGSWHTVSGDLESREEVISRLGASAYLGTPHAEVRVWLRQSPISSYGSALSGTRRGACT